MGLAIDAELSSFARKHQLDGLTAPSLKAIVEGQSGYSIDKGKRFLEFQKRINKELLQHRVIVDNRYTAWFQQGQQSLEQIRNYMHTDMPNFARPWASPMETVVLPSPSPRGVIAETSTSFPGSRSDAACASSSTLAIWRP